MASHLWTGVRLWWVHRGSDGETEQAPFHPLLMQIKIKAILKGSACAQVIWGPVRKNPGENTSLIPIHILTDRETNVSPCLKHTLSTSTWWLLAHGVMKQEQKHNRAAGWRILKSVIFMYVFNICTSVHKHVRNCISCREGSMQLHPTKTQANGENTYLAQMQWKYRKYKHIQECCRLYTIQWKRVTTQDLWMWFARVKHSSVGLQNEITMWVYFGVNILVAWIWYHWRYWLYT